MSAFIVSRTHIQYLVGFAAQQQIQIHINLGSHKDWHKASDKGVATKLGGILLNTNVEAVNTRYNEDTVAEPFQFKPATFGSYDPVQVLKACNCYEYQACELDEYEATEAFRIINAIRSAAIHALPGYDEAAWEVSTLVSK